MARLSKHYVLSVCRNLSGQKVFKLQYDTVEICKLNQMVPAKYSSEICNFIYKIQCGNNKRYYALEQTTLYKQQTMT